MTTAYTLANNNAICKRKDNKLWEITDVSSMTLTNLFQIYHQIEFHLLDNLNNKITLESHSYIYKMKYSTLTIGEWLTSNGDSKLVTKDGHTSLEYKTACYTPFNYVKMSILPALAGHHPTQTDNPVEANDLIIDVDGYDTKKLYETALFSVNGMFLPTEYQNYGVRVLHGMELIKRSGKLHGGIHDFSGIGNIKTIPITKSMVSKIDDNKSYHDKIVINAGEDIGNKTVGIVIAGNLHLADNLIKIIGDNIITLSLRNLSFVDRTVRSKDIMDLTFMGLDDIDSNTVTKNVLSDNAILEYITSKYSFLVLIDNPNVVFDDGDVSSASMHKTFIRPETNHLGMLLDELGMLVEYWPKIECGLLAIKTDYQQIKNLVMKDVDWHHTTRFNNAGDGEELYRPADLTYRTYKGRS